MVSCQTNTTRIGEISALTVALSLGVFGLLLALSLFELNTIYISFVVVMVMGVSWVVMCSYIYTHSREAQRLYALLGMIGAMMFSCFISIAYYLQLAVVRSNPLGLTDDVTRLISYEPGSVSFALDMLGFTFLCMSVGALIPLFTSSKDRILRFFLWVNALFALPTFMFPIFFINQSSSPDSQTGSVVLLAWCLLFLPVPVILASRLRDGMNYAN